MVHWSALWPSNPLVAGSNLADDGLGYVLFVDIAPKNSDFLECSFIQAKGV